MLTLDHIAAAGPGVMPAGGHLSRRLGFTLSRGDDEGHLRIVLTDGYLDLRDSDGAADWRWTGFTLRTDDIQATRAALKQAGLSPRSPQPAGSGPDGQPTRYELELADPAVAGTLPRIVQMIGPVRPQDAMAPERAQAVVVHKNTAAALGGLVLLAPDYRPVVDLYERLLGVAAGEVFDNDVLGIEGRRLTLPDGKEIAIAKASYGTGPAARFAEMYRSGIFAAIVRVGSLPQAADCLRGGSIYSYFNDDRLITSSALPGYGGLIMESTPVESAR